MFRDMIPAATYRSAGTGPGRCWRSTAATLAILQLLLGATPGAAQEQGAAPSQPVSETGTENASQSAPDPTASGTADATPAVGTPVANPIGTSAEDPAREDPFSPEPIFTQPNSEPARVARQRQFVPAAVPQVLPEMRLRGIGRMASTGGLTVLLEIARHGMFVVSEGDTITLQALQAENVIRIREITDISVIVEVGSFGEVIVVR